MLKPLRDEEITDAYESWLDLQDKEKIMENISDPHVNRRIGRRKFIKAWSWPAEVEQFIAEMCEGYTVHVCSGSSEMGDLRIDKYMPADKAADMLKLPLQNWIADTVICDPPWGVPRHLRARLIYELRRIMKIGGKLIFNAPWMPRAPGLELENIWIAESTAPMNDCGVISVFRKVNNELAKANEIRGNEVESDIELEG